MFIKRDDTELQTQRKMQKAAATLGFTKHQVVTVDIVRKRFAEVVKACHPDVILTPGEEPQPAVDLNSLCRAKDYLLKQMEKSDG